MSSVTMTAWRTWFFGSKSGLPSSVSSPPLHSFLVCDGTCVVVCSLRPSSASLGWGQGYLFHVAAGTLRYMNLSASLAPTSARSALDLGYSTTVPIGMAGMEREGGWATVSLGFSV